MYADVRLVKVDPCLASGVRNPEQVACYATLLDSHAGDAHLKEVKPRDGRPVGCPCVDWSAYR